MARDTFWDAFVQFSNRERQRRAEGGLHDDQGRDRGPVRLRHLHQPRDNNRQSRGDCCASRVRNPRRFFLSQAHSFIKESSSLGVWIGKVTIFYQNRQS